MKRISKNSKNSTKLFYLLIILIFSAGANQKANAVDIFFGPATYINGNDTTTFPVNCEDLFQLEMGSTITFVVYATATSITDFLRLSADTLPPGATFPVVSGLIGVHSTFTWSPVTPYLGPIGFYILTYGPPWCYLNFDIALPVELSSFNSIINGNNVTLNWQTLTESNNSRFEIERANVENEIVRDWNKIKTIEGNGTTTTPVDYTFTDKGLNTGVYEYRLKQVDYNGNYEYHNLNNNVQIGIPIKFELSQNYPNPFNPSTLINFNLTTGDQVSLKVYNSSGMEVGILVDDYTETGYHTVKFDGTGLSSGIYYYKLISGSFSSVKKMMLIK